MSWGSDILTGSDCLESRTRLENETDLTRRTDGRTDESSLSKQTSTMSKYLCHDTCYLFYLSSLSVGSILRAAHRQNKVLLCLFAQKQFYPANSARYFQNNAQWDVIKSHCAQRAMSHHGWPDRSRIMLLCWVIGFRHGVELTAREPYFTGAHVQGQAISVPGAEMYLPSILWSGAAQ